MLPAMSRSLTRIATVMAALLVCAWFAIGIRQSHDTDTASALLSGSGPIGHRQARQAAAALKSAQVLNPDTSPVLLQSTLALREGQTVRARAVALRVAREEPQNTAAWLAYGSTAAHDPVVFRLALRQLTRLAPPVRANR